MHRNSKSIAWHCIPRVLSTVTLSLISVLGQAAVLDLAKEPLTSAIKVKPNLLIMLDDSASMGLDYMPDDFLSGTLLLNDRNGFRSAQCNGVAFDPTQSYPPPIKADGTSYPNASFRNAWTDGYDTSKAAVDLSSEYYYAYTGRLPAMSWKYTATGVVLNQFYEECMSAPGVGPFTRVNLSSASAEIQQRYANWFSFYRKRYLLMRTAMGLSLSDLDAKYRIGFGVISDGSKDENGKENKDSNKNFLDVKDFTSSQKANFYKNLYEAPLAAATPLRGALSKAGRYFANKVKGQGYDPVQYSCQRNVVLLSTDGYWNTADEKPDFGPMSLASSVKVGQQDGNEVRPMKDRAVDESISLTPQERIVKRVSISGKAKISTYTVTTTYPTAQGSESSNAGKYLRNVVTFQSIEWTDRIKVQPESAKETRTKRVRTLNGIAGDPTYENFNPGRFTNDGPPSSFDTGSSYNVAWEQVSFIQLFVDQPGNGQPVTSEVTTSDGRTEYRSRPAGDWVDGSTTTTSNSRGDPNTLADVAQYYYVTDLRNADLGNCQSSSSGVSRDVCADNVPTTGADTLRSQHMNTFTLGLGVNGTLAYDRNYLTQRVGDFADLKSGAKDWPSPAETPLSGNATNVDDLWHAAVNGRGRYFAASNVAALKDALGGILSAVTATTGGGSATGISSTQFIAGTDNLVYGASYRTVEWTGDVQAFKVNQDTGALAATATWSAQALLDQRAATRKIFFNGAGTLKSFDYDQLNATQKALFSGFCSKSPTPVQCANLTSAEQTAANDGAKLVAYLRGVRTHESASTTTDGSLLNPLYRARQHLLGDIIGGGALRVGKPPFSYADAGYASFVSSKASRKPVIYAAANDGMLHAFSAGTSDGGAELWAYVPSMVMPQMYKLATTDYGDNHQPYVDATPVMGDIKVGDNWKTILVGGLNAGGKGYYALDITDPENPAALWEFGVAQDADLGYSYGKPIITKRADGTWVVALTSGYNNQSGDGKGYLYLLNAATGESLAKIGTDAGSKSTPSGLAQINAWVDSPSDNTAKRFYGGDLLGNVWRFDIDGLVSPKNAALKLATLTTSNNMPQPITTTPVLAQIAGQAVVMVGTGQYLGTDDLTTTDQQSVYAIKDPLTNDPWGNVRTRRDDFVLQTITVSGSTATVSNQPVDWTTKAGWRLDLPQTGERIAVDMLQQYDMLIFGTAIPGSDPCKPTGSSWVYQVDISNGGNAKNESLGQIFAADALITGLTGARTANGTRGFYGARNDGGTGFIKTGTGSKSGKVRRVAWRELVK